MEPHRDTFDRDVDVNQPDGRRIVFVMKNPSDGNEQYHDRTTKVCTNIAEKWGFAHVVIVNLVTTRQGRAPQRTDEEDFDAFQNTLRDAVSEADRVVFAWGHLKTALLRARAEHVIAYLKDAKERNPALEVKHVGRTEKGFPKCIGPRAVPFEKAISDVGDWRFE